MVDRGVLFLFVAIVAIIPTCFSISGIANSGTSSCDDAFACIPPFVSAFTNAAQSSNILSNLFDISRTTPSNYRRFLYDYIFTSATKRGMASPETIASSATQPIEEYLDSLTTPVMVKIFANSVANILQSQGVLNPTNAISMGLSYANALEDIARKNVVEGQVETKLKTIADGFEKFLTSVDLLTVDQGISIATSFANAVKRVGEELRGK